MAETGNRQWEGAGGGAGEGGKKKGCSSEPTLGGGGAGAGPELPGATLGSGVRWGLRQPVDRDAADRKKVQDKFSAPGADEDAARLSREVEGLRMRCGALLEQALEGSEHGDVSFRFEDGRCPFTGHRAVLCAASEEYAGMFRSRMVEGQEGIIGVPPGVSEAGYRGLLEWVYLGRAGEECARADGRELWVLGEMYEVAGMREWLLEEAIDSSNVLGAYEFGMLGEGVDREGIVARCLRVAEEAGWAFEEASLRGVGREAVEGLSLARARQGGDGRRLGWRCVRDAVRVAEGWTRANGGVDVSWYRGVVSGLDYTGMPLDVFVDVVVGCEYADGLWASGVLERKRASGGNLYEREYKVGRRYDLGEDSIAWCAIALHGEGSSQRIAVADRDNSRVVIYNVESGDHVATFGSEGYGPGQFWLPQGMAFSGTGELYVGDINLNRIQVFDREGRYVRGFGERGEGEGQFFQPRGLCFTADGDLVVADGGNNRVQVFREDGTFVRSFGSLGEDKGEFRYPCEVCVLPDGSIAVVDFGNSRVQVFDGEGGFVRSIGSEGGGPGQFLNPLTVAVGAGGEIIVGDCGRHDVQVFSKEGELLQIIGAGGDSDVKFEDFKCMCHVFVTDASGGIFMRSSFSDRSLLYLC